MPTRRRAMPASSPACGRRCSSARTPIEPPDVDEDLYGGFIGNEDRRTLQRLRALEPGEAGRQATGVLPTRGWTELLFRFRARNFPETLHAAEQVQWQEHCADRLCEGSAGALGLREFGERLAALEAGADERGRGILAALRAYAQQIAPDCGAAP